MMADLEALMNDATFIGSVHEHEGKSFTVALADNFSYTDPIDASISSKQVIWNQSLQFVENVFKHFYLIGIADHFSRRVAHSYSSERYRKFRSHRPPLHR